MKLKNPIRPYFYGLLTAWTALNLLFMSFICVTTQQLEPTEIKQHAVIDLHFFLLLVVWMLGLLGLFWGYYAMMTAVREREGLEHELMRALKLETLKLLATGIAHNFNNFMQIIRMSIDLIKAENELSEDSKFYLTSADSAMDRATALASKLLIFSHEEAPRRGLIKLNLLVSEFAEIGLAGTNIKFKLELEPNLPDIFADSDLICQLILDMIINAKQAMPTGGNLEIMTMSCCNTQPAPLLAKADYVKIVFRDNGCGISAKNLKHIYDPFFSTKDFGGGLGLFSAHAIVESHGGDISVSSVENIGTTFTVYLPCAP